MADLQQVKDYQQALYQKPITLKIYKEALRKHQPDYHKSSSYQQAWQSVLLIQKGI